VTYVAKGLTYKEAGVDVDAGNRAVVLMRDAVRSTFRPEVLTDVGGFGALFRMKQYREPILVSGTDGVGTKLKVAFMMNKHDSVGIDLVAMSVNDILVSGAEPLFFLDYIGAAKVEPEQIAEIVGGVAAGCREAGCALIGGETAELPGLYSPGEYDLAGFAVGVVEQSKVVDGRDICSGDVLIGLPSAGFHSNGYSLIRKIVFEQSNLSSVHIPEELGVTVGEELLRPTRIYVKSVLPLVQKGLVRGMVHITGGGFVENIPRVLPEGLGAVITRDSWPVLPAFKWLKTLGNLEEQEMFRTFNMGIGFVLVVRREEARQVMSQLREIGEESYIIGQIAKGAGVRFE
jgi:phosphoribosylformylglycinamidine cyclo-ligase